MNDRLILFDIDGTLVDTAGAGRAALERAFAGVFGIEDAASRGAGVRFAGMSDGRIFADLADAMGIEPLRYQDGARQLEQNYLDALDDEMARRRERARVLPGVGEVLDRLQQEDRVHLGLITGNLESGARIKLEPFGLNDYFADGGFGSDHRDRRQIARIAWEKMATRVGVEFVARQVVVVGDTDQDVDCARANGFRAVAVRTGWAADGELERSRPDALLDDLSDAGRAVEALLASG